MGAQCAVERLRRPAFASASSDRSSAAPVSGAPAAFAVRPGLLSDHPRCRRTPRLIARTRPESAHPSRARGTRSCRHNMSRTRCNGSRSCCAGARTWACTRMPPATASWRGSTRIVTSHANGIEIRDRHARRTGRHRRSSDAGLAHARRSRGVHGDANRDGRRGGGHRADDTRTACHQSFGYARNTRHGRSRRHARSAQDRSDVQLHVTIAAQGVSAERLRALVEESHRCSPVPCAMQKETPVGLHIEVTNG